MIALQHAVMPADGTAGAADLLSSPYQLSAALQRGIAGAVAGWISLVAVTPRSISP